MAAVGEVATLAGHTEDVVAVQAAPDGRIITSSWDCTVKVWRDGACERTIQAHDDWVRTLAVLPGGTRFVSVSDDGTVKLWTLDGTLERTIVGAPGEPVDDDEGVCVAICVAALPDGVHFAVGNNDDEVQLYHVDGTLVHTFKGHETTLFSLAVTSDGQHIISGSHDHPIKVWNVATKSLLTCVPAVGHADFVTSVAVMPDGQRVLSGLEDSTIRVWLLDGTLDEHSSHELNDQIGEGPRDAAQQPARALRIARRKGQALQRLRRRRPAHLQAPHLFRPRHGGLPGAATRGLRFVSGSNDDSARIVYHGLAPH